jgi:hypothetical protein
MTMFESIVVVGGRGGGDHGGGDRDGGLVKECDSSTTILGQYISDLTLVSNQLLK